MRDHNSARYEPGRSDPARKWVITRKAPVARLLIDGAIWGFTRSCPPPAELIGRRICLHGGTGRISFKSLETNAKGKNLVARMGGVPDPDWKSGLKNIQERDAGLMIGDARLAAAFELGRAHIPPLGAGDAGVYSWRPDSRRHKWLGDWQKFDGQRMVPFDNFDAAGKASARWVWCFDQPHHFGIGDRKRLKGFGDLWDFELGWSLRERQRLDLERSEYQAALAAEREDKAATRGDAA